MAVNKGRRTLGLVLAAGAIAAAGGWWALRPGTQVAPPQMPDPGAGALPGVDLRNVPELVLGNPDAKVTVTEYASYTCPHCATFHRDVFKPLLRDYIEPGRIRFVYREVFFDRFGLWAAMVARCGGEERYFGIADLLYAILDPRIRYD